jgi:hypothetical protein
MVSKLTIWRRAVNGFTLVSFALYLSAMLQEIVDRYGCRGVEGDLQGPFCRVCE